MTFPNKRFNNILPGEPVCICIEGEFGFSTLSQIRNYIKNKITPPFSPPVDITDICWGKREDQNVVYICFADWFIANGQPYKGEMENITDAFSRGFSYAISGGYDQLNQPNEWVIRYVDSVLSYSNIVDKFILTPSGEANDDDTFSIYGPMTNLVDDDTASTHSSMPSLVEIEKEEEEEEEKEERARRRPLARREEEKPAIGPGALVYLVVEGVVMT